MSYAADIEKIAEQIGQEARTLRHLEKDRASWVKPKGKSFQLGEYNYPVVRESGTITPGLEGIQREALKLLDGMILSQKSKIEGLRFKLVQLGKTGGAA